MTPPELTLECPTEADTRTFAAELAAELGAGSVVALIGDLGAGKTTFVRGLADALGLEEGERVSSPSYALVNTYRLRAPIGGATELVHLDLYRIGDEDELEALGWDELHDHAIIVVEWPAQAPRVLSEASHVLRFAHSREHADGRTVRLSRRTSRP